MDEKVKAAFEAAARKAFPEIDLAVTDAGIYRNTTTRNQFEAFCWGLASGLEKAHG